MAMIDIRCEWDEPAILGEGPVWVERENAVYWLDIVGSVVHRIAIPAGTRRTWQLAQPLTSLVPRAHGGFVGTLRDGYAFVDLDRGVLTPIELPEAGMRGNRFNDGKVDSQGRYWAGSMDEGEKRESGSLYCLDVDRTVRRMDGPYVIANGPAFSPDGRTLYHADTGKRTVYAFDLDVRGAIANRRTFVVLDAADEGYPDGMTTDCEGCIWLCHFAGARITRYSPAGRRLEVIRMPVPNVTSCAFAGPELDTLYITTARYLLGAEELLRFPLAGSLFSCKPGVRGLPARCYAG